MQCSKGVKHPCHERPLATLKPGPSNYAMPTAAPPFRQAARGPITFGVLLATVMGALDMTVVNVALPHMQGDLSASPEQITWVLTSYIVTVAVMTPLSGWLVAQFGLKLMLLTCITGFTLTSVLCGMATSMPQIVIFRVMQGMLAAPMMPAAQAVLLNIYPPERLGRAMAIFTMAAVVAPVIGPVVGGYLTEDFSWRWCFYINVPAGIGAAALLFVFLPAEPAAPRPFDFLGFGTLGLTISAFQLMLDRGTTKDWFGSNEICIEAAVAVTAFCVYLAHTLTTRQRLFPAALFQDRNLLTSAAFSFCFSFLLFGSLTVLPLMMQGVLGYSVIHTGILSMPRGVVMMAVLQIMGRLDALVNRQLLLSIGLVFIVTAFWQMSQFDLSMTGEQIVWATMLQGIGQGIISVPMTTLGFATILPGLRADASAFTNLMRNLGGSVGVAAIQAVTVVNMQTMHASMANHFTSTSPMLISTHPGFLSPRDTRLFSAEITRQATMVAYVDDFWLMSVMALMCFALVLLLRQPPKQQKIGKLPVAEAGHG